MALPLNIRHLEMDSIHLQGELTADELDMQVIDELSRLAIPVKYDLNAEMLQGNILVQGRLDIVLRCECARCLKPFDWPLILGDWVCHLTLEGEEKEPVNNDLVDLTPHIREDIFLALPQHPVCNPECQGLPGDVMSQGKPPDRGCIPDDGASTWAALDKLKLD